MGIHADDNRSYQSLDDSERAILAVASRFIAAWIQNGTLTDANADKLIDKAVNMAVQLSDKIDEAVQGENEL